jgi:hypothetical protein
MVSLDLMGEATTSANDMLMISVLLLGSLVNLLEIGREGVSITPEEVLASGDDVTGFSGFTPLGGSFLSFN